MLGDGKSCGPDHVLYVCLLGAVVVVFPIDGPKRTVTSDTADPVCRKGEVLDPDSTEGNGKSPGCILEFNKTLNRFDEDVVLLGDDEHGDNKGHCSLPGSTLGEGESLSIVCFCGATAECWARRTCAFMTYEPELAWSL
jgi:hypothetical protein